MIYCVLCNYRPARLQRSNPRGVGAEGKLTKPSLNAKPGLGWRDATPAMGQCQAITRLWSHAAVRHSRLCLESAKIPRLDPGGGDSDGNGNGDSAMERGSLPKLEGGSHDRAVGMVLCMK